VDQLHESGERLTGALQNIRSDVIPLRGQPRDDWSQRGEVWR
jgi:hypothetical protein